LYQKDPINRHHRRLNIARPASDIDIWAVVEAQCGQRKD
jgi:hypothetical protein